MTKRTKTYRGQRKYKNRLYNGCGCFHCTGYSKQDRYKIKLKAIKEE